MPNWDFWGKNYNIFFDTDVFYGNNDGILLLESAEEKKMIVAVNSATIKLFKFKTGKYNLKEQAAWKSRTAFVEDTLQEILRKAANKEATVFAKCCYGIELGRSEAEDRYLLSYDDAVSYWKNFDARVYQIA